MTYAKENLHRSFAINIAFSAPAFVSSMYLNLTFSCTYNIYGTQPISKHEMQILYDTT